MSDSVLLRPGAAIGQYPQREDVRENWLDRAMAGASGAVRSLLRSRTPNYQRFVDRVNVRADAERLGELDDAELKQFISSIRYRLYSEGFRDEDLVALAFGAVREVADRRIGLRHHDVQLYGGHVMLQGMIAEMETGEGKTLAATLPACVAAMAGIPVHIVTVNDFLVARDARWMEPVYRAFGLSVGTITEGIDLDTRRAAYACDITYCTNKQLAFDYLKDRLLLGQENRRLHLQVEGLYRDQPRTSRLLLRGVCFAIVDEADSVLIDEARTPLIISNKGEAGQEEHTYREALDLARLLAAPLEYTIRTRDKRVELTDFGRARIAKQAKPLGGVWTGARRREELVRMALSALHLYSSDKNYLLREGKIQIIDEYTGRVMPDRSWEHGLHQMIETKEGLAITGRQETLARISYQKFFRRYLRLAGMTGTAQEVTGELWSVYRLGVVHIPTNRPVQRKVFRERVYRTETAKWHAVIEAVRELHRQGRPVLIGTRSVAASDHLSARLHACLLPHQVLNARQDQEEAQIIAQAGQRGHITVATNMAGRGTDIRLAPGVVELGGLHVLATERHDARRIDRQLFGRCGRQGDPGSYQAILSLDDELIEGLYGEKLGRLPDRWLDPAHALPSWLSYLLVGSAQKSAEYVHGRTRRDLLRLDDNLSDLLAFSGRLE